MRKKFTLLWIAVVVVGILLAILVWMSIRIANKANDHLVRHRAFSVLSGIRTVMRARGQKGPKALKDVLPMLKGPGILHIGLVDWDLKYRFSSNAEDVGRPTRFSVVINALDRQGKFTQDVLWKGMAARVFVFSRGRGPGMRMMRHRGPGRFVLEVVVATSNDHKVREIADLLRMEWIHLRAWGDFAPLLFIGAMLGGAYGVGIEHLLPNIGLSPGSYAMVGMGAMLAATDDRPIRAGCCQNPASTAASAPIRRRRRRNRPGSTREARVARVSSRSRRCSRLAGSG